MERRTMKAKEKVLRCLDEKREEVVDLCCKLVQIPSITPAYGGNMTDIARFIREYLEHNGVNVETHDFWLGSHLPNLESEGGFDASAADSLRSYGRRTYRRGEPLVLSAFLR